MRSKRPAKTPKKPQKQSWKQFNQLRFSQKVLSKKVRSLEKNTTSHARHFVVDRLDKLSEVRRYVVGWVVLVILLSVVSVAQWSMFRKSFTVEAYEPGGSFSEGVLGPLETLNPIYARSSAEKSAAKLLFSSLYRYDKRGQLKADLASDMTISEDETEYTITLKEDLKWSDGEDLTARDVIFTIDLLSDPSTSAEIVGWDNVTAEQVDDKSLKITLSAPYAPMDHALTFPILPSHKLSNVAPNELREHSFGQNPVGSGPFSARMIRSARSDGTKKTLYMVANSHHHRGEPNLERFQLYAYNSKDDIIAGLKTSEIMATSELDRKDLPDDLRRRVTFEPFSINDGVYALFNSQSELLKSKNVRLALSRSVNTEALMQELDVNGNPLSGPLLNSTNFPAKVTPPTYNTEAARKILNESGWILDEKDGVRKKDGVPLELSVVAFKGSEYGNYANKLVEIWEKELKVKAEVRIVDLADSTQNVLQSVLQPRNYDVLVYEMEIGGDPDVYAHWHSSQVSAGGLNFANYSSTIADEALASGRSRRDFELRQDRYEIFVKQWHEDTPAIALYQPKVDYIQTTDAKTIDENTALVYPADRYTDVVHWAVRKTNVYKTP